VEDEGQQVYKGVRMYIVSGCPRSGTSMMMRVMETVFGQDRVLRGAEEATSKRPEPTELQKYILDKKDPKWREKQNRAKDMNPNGYYEMDFCVKGIWYRPFLEDMMNKLEVEEQPTICKVVSQGLARSNPRYVDKIIYMARNPRSVAKSQERLGRDNPMNPEDAPEVDGKKQLMRTVNMYIDVTIKAARWLSKHAEIPVLVVDYDRLLNDPVSVMSEISSFLGEGDFSNAHTLVDTKLRRSQPATDQGDDWSFADALHLKVLSSSWDDIVTMAKAEAEKPKDPVQWFCTRLNTNVVKQMCELCKSHEITRNNMKKNAEGKGIDWVNEPCIMDCILSGETISDSIAGNHWLV